MFLIYWNIKCCAEKILLGLFILSKIILREIEAFSCRYTERILATFYLFTLIIHFALKTVARKDDKSNCKRYVCVSIWEERRKGIFPPNICTWLMTQSHREAQIGDSASQLAVLSLGSWFLLVILSDLYSWVFQRASSYLSEWWVSTLFQDKASICLWAP